MYEIPTVNFDLPMHVLQTPLAPNVICKRFGKEKFKQKSFENLNT